MEIEENSELDLFEAFNKHADDLRILGVVKEMEEELGTGNQKPEILTKLAQYELNNAVEDSIKYDTSSTAS